MSLCQKPKHLKPCHAENLKTLNEQIILEKAISLLCACYIRASSDLSKHCLTESTERPAIEHLVCI